MKATNLTTMTDVQNLLVRFWNDSTKPPFKLYRYTYARTESEGQAPVVYQLEYSRINKWNLPQDVGETLYAAWRKDKYGELQGTKTVQGIAKALGITAETKKVAVTYEAEQLEKRRQAANANVRHAIDQAVAEIRRVEGRATGTGSWTHETMVQYFQLALESANV
jgi:hypothetical protein